MKKVIAIIVLLGLIGYTVWQYVEDKKSEVVGLEIGNTPPDFELPIINGDGETIRLSDLKGKKVILNFWASWCGPCKEEMPAMQEFYANKPVDVELLAVNMTITETNKENVAKFLDGKGFTFPILLDEKNEPSSDYDILVVPSTFFINSDGTLNDSVKGELSLDQFKSYVNKLD